MLLDWDPRWRCLARSGSVPAVGCEWISATPRHFGSATTWVGYIY